ncbi:YdcF family protein [Polaromonas sp.]|uniref:YdcF family protein n=1 Tax=Polaromonas sp. TaxID=1869339 RepID=UPI0013BB63C0|nr:YdcF family protein [Polaromonas sp.]NDP64398.1 YdcF family protein [Polaromonas sp.]
MELGVFKPLLTSLAMPPMAPLLLALFGVLLDWRRKRGGLALIALSLAALWLLSCHGTAVWLARHALPQFEAVTTAQLKANQVQAVVILGGGVLPGAPEYGGAPQPSPVTAARLRYGIWLARQSGLPLAFSGGIGWAADGMQPASEADVAARVAQQEFGFALRWSEAVSRDTDGNARLLAPVLMREGVQRIALVTDAWHMPRSVAAFERAGFTVTPAPMGFTLPVESPLLQWLPSAQGLLASRQVLRECLGLAVGQFTPL